MASNSLMEEPICLINNINAELKVNQPALKILKGIHQPLVVVSIVGLYRTGKSYLMNKLANKNKGFPLGSTIQAKTKGIWMWCVPHPIEPSNTLVLLDTEGLADVEKGDTKNDVWLFSLALLLSSTFVYNSVGTINEKAVQDLQFVTELTKYIKVKAKGQTDEDDFDSSDEAQLVRFMPDFVWVVRDMTLEMKLGKQELTDAEYLEYALKLKKGFGREVTDHNLPRQCIMAYFSTRNCFVFVRPTSEDKINNMESLTENDLEPKFTEKVRMFCDYIYKNTEVKKVIGGHEVNGNMFSFLVQTYVDTIMSGSIPCLENAVLSMATIENQMAIKDAVEYYKSEMQKLVSFPVEVQEMSDLHQQCERGALQVFSKRSFKDDEGEYRKQFVDQLTKCYIELQEKNEKCSLDKCHKLLEELSGTLDKNLKDRVYTKPGGYEMYAQDLDEVVKQFKMSPNKGVKAEDALNEYLISKSGEGKAILEADKTLGEAEKILAEEKERTALTEQKNKMLEEEKLKADQQLKDQNHTYQENLAQLKSKMAEDIENMKKEQEKAMESKMKLQAEMQEKGFKEYTRMLESQITDLKKEASEVRKKDAAEGIIGSIMNGIMGIVKQVGKHARPEGASCPINWSSPGTSYGVTCSYPSPICQQPMYTAKPSGSSCL